MTIISQNKLLILFSFGIIFFQISLFLQDNFYSYFYFPLIYVQVMATDPLATVDKEKTDILMYCTGGIRCDVYSTILRQILFNLSVPGSFSVCFDCFHFPICMYLHVRNQCSVFSNRENYSIQYNVYLCPYILMNSYGYS